MPPVKPRDMEDTWNPAELEKSLKGSKDDRKKSRDKDRDKDRERRKEKPKDDEERKQRRRKEEDGDRKDKDRGKRDRDKERDKDRDKDKDREKRDKDRERRHRDKENGETVSKTKQTKPAGADANGEERRHRRKEGDEKDEDRECRRRKHKEEGEDKDKDKERRRRHHDGEDDDERRKRRDDRKKTDDDGRERRPKDRDEDREHRRKRPDETEEERRQRHRREDENGERKRHRDDKDKDPDRERRREERERRHRDEDGKSSRHRDKEKEKEEIKEEKVEKKTATKKEASSIRRSSKTGKNNDTFTVKSPRHSRSPHNLRNSLQSIKSKSKGGLKIPPSRSPVAGTSSRHKKDPVKSVVKEHPITLSTSSSFELGSPIACSSAVEDADEYNYDDDDFEDYEEDFEDDDDEDDNVEISEKEKVDSPPMTTPRSVRDVTSGYIRSKNWEDSNQSRQEMDDILQAMDAENNRLVKESQNHDDDEDNKESYENSRHKGKGSKQRPTTGKPRSFINFVSAKQRVVSSKASMRARTRGRELLQIIELDRAAYDLFDMPPVSEYELYMRTYGRSDTKQKYIQTNEDNIDKDIQTEEIETLEKWVQCPPEDTKGCGGDKDTEEEEAIMKPVDTVALTKFVQNAGQAILILLEEDRAEASQTDTSQKRSNICLSEAFLEIAAPPFLKDRCVSCTHFSEAQTNLLLTVHDRQDIKYPGDKLSSKGAVCVWNVNEPSHPQKVLLCEGQPQCCCFSPVKANLVFAGMMDGSVVVWDLREPNSLHKQHIEGDESWFLRYPTYNTAGVLHYENHQSAVASIVPIFVPGSVDDMDSDVGTTSFQLATVEENATLHLWVVAEIAHPDAAGSESDLGLAPGGKVKLIKSSAIVLESPMRDSRLRTTMKAFEMKLLPSDPSHFYVGTDTGYVIHGVRHGGKAPPKAYKPDIDAPFEVTSIDFSPFTEPVFLAGCADGSIRLYHINNAAPMIVWESTTSGRPVLAVRWCQSRPSVFFVVDAASRLYIWDLLMSDATPMKEEIISKDRLTSFCLSNDYAATGAGIAGRKPAMAVSFETGRVEVHTVSQQFSALMPEEVDQFAQFLGNSN